MGGLIDKLEGVAFFTYNALYPLLGTLGAPFIIYKLASQYKYRAGLSQKLGLELPEEIPHKRRIWFHAVSVGETLAVAPVVERLKNRRPELGIYFSTTTYTGMDVAKKRLGGVVDSFFYFPLDFYPIVLKVLSRVRPCAVCIVETEIWPSLAHLCAQRGIPLISINARISDSSFSGYLKLRPFIKGVLSKYERFFARSREDAARLIALGVPPDKVEVLGNIKFFSVYSRSKEIDAERIREALGVSSEPVWVCGSTHPGEEKMIIEAYRRIEEKPKLIIAPRHPERFNEVASLLKEAGLQFGRRSKQETLKDHPVLLLDTMGELFGVYSVAHAVFVGGTLVNVGGHSPLEPLVFGKPTIIGPYYHNFRDVVEQMRDFLIFVKDSEQLAEAVRKVLKGEYALDSNRLKESFARAAGAVERIVEALEGVCDRD